MIECASPSSEAQAHPIEELRGARSHHLQKEISIKTKVKPTLSPHLLEGSKQPIGRRSLYVDVAVAPKMKAVRRAGWRHSGRQATVA